MRKTHAALAAALLAGSALALAAPASAADYDPNVTRTANPANACASIPGSLEHAGGMLGVEIDTGDFDYAACVSTLAKGQAYVDVPGFGSPYAQCASLEAMFLTYPYTFHAGDSLEDVLLPDLRAHNRKQCGSALYAFHAIFTAVAPYLPAEQQ
jgi:opacity protein-like surface antigen